MQNREILIANNRDQSKYRVVTGAETLGQLQEDIARNENVYKMVGQTWLKAENPIDISGLTFTEGITKTQLLSPDTQLPTNVQFRGQTTNNLVMLLTNPNKQIRSGAGDRKEAYRLVKENNLQEAVKMNFGRNFTQVPTDDLLAFAHSQSATEAIREVREELKDQEKVKEAVKLPDVKTAPHAQTVEWFYTGIKSMVKDSLLAAEDVTVLASLLTELALRLEEEKPKIAPSDVDAMMKALQR